MSYALGHYDSLSDAEKTELHETKMKELTDIVDSVKTRLPEAVEEYRTLKRAWTEFKKDGPSRKRKAARTRAEELEREMEPLQMELEVERAAARVDRLRKEKAEAVRWLNREKLFTIDEQ
jgi:chromosome segregation ATPase